MIVLTRSLNLILCSPVAHSNVAAHDSVKPKGKDVWACIDTDHLPQVATDSLKRHSAFTASPASVCGAPAATPGHPEPREPPVSAGPSGRRAAVRFAQMAPVHPVQDGSGGDPVVRGCLAVLPHVTRPVVTLGPQDALSP